MSGCGFSEETRAEIAAGLDAEAKARTASEAALDADEHDSPLMRAKLARRFLKLLFDYGLLNQDHDYFNLQLREIAAELGVPYMELFLAYEAPMDEPEVTREEIAAWHAWCQQHAPERLAVQKEGA